MQVEETGKCPFVLSLLPFHAKFNLQTVVLCTVGDGRQVPHGKSRVQALRWCSG